MKRVHFLCLTTVVGGLLAGPVLAQNRVQPPRDPNMPAPQNTIPEKIKPEDPSSTGSTGTLSDKLEQSDGVIKPPSNISPDMSIPAPDTGTTPVIPPPGSPGGNQNVEPK
jgi:hypothetical protein